MSKTVEELKAELAAMKAGQDVPLTMFGGFPTEQADLIPDDDPELIKYMEGPIYDALPDLRRTLVEAKAAVARARKDKRLRAVLFDESKPMVERIETAKEWVGTAAVWHPLRRLSSEEVVRRETARPNEVWW